MKEFLLYIKEFFFFFYSSFIQTFRGAVRGVPTVLLPMDEQFTDARNSPQVYNTTLGYISGQTSWVSFKFVTVREHGIMKYLHLQMWFLI